MHFRCNQPWLDLELRRDKRRALGAAHRVQELAAKLITPAAKPRVQTHLLSLTPAQDAAAAMMKYQWAITLDRPEGELRVEATGGAILQRSNGRVVATRANQLIKKAGAGRTIRASGPGDSKNNTKLWEAPIPKKKAAEAKRKQSVVEVKEIKLRPKTDDHDIAFKTKAARRFLEAGHKVKFTVRFRGREITHPEKAQEQLTLLIQGVEDLANVETRAMMEARAMSILVAPKPAIMQKVAQARAAAEKARQKAIAEGRAATTQHPDDEEIEKLERELEEKDDDDEDDDDDE